MTPAKRSGKLGYLAFADEPPAVVPSLVVVAGKADVLADEVVRTLVERAITDQSLRGLNVDTVDAASPGLGAIAEKIAAVPFLAPRRVVIVRGTIDLKKEEREVVASVSVDVPEHAVLIIDHSGKPKRPQGRRPMEEAAAFAKLTSGSLLVDCTLNAADCARYIERYAASLGIEIDAGARDALAGTEDVAEIRNVLDRLALTTKRVREEDVKDYALSTDEAKLWDIGDAVNSGDAVEALRLARAAVGRAEEAVGPLIWLARDAQIVWELGNGAKPDAYARASGQHPWRTKKLSWIARKFSPQLAHDRADIALKALEQSLSGRRRGDQALEEVIVRLTGRSGSSRKT